jgi:nitrate/TMAO reductase-like tetraheme cytochrome c subunit
LKTKSKLSAKLRKLFWPGNDAPLSVRLLPYLILVVLALAFLLGGIGGWAFTNSTSFCGTSCHTMPPQYITYLRSSHARVQCVECHLGRDTFFIQLERKIVHTKTLYALIFNAYEYPIVAKEMRPANEACETCHYPQKFSNDAMVEIKSHENDEKNTPKSIFLLMKTGGGTQRQGLGYGIHWHIENKITYMAADELRQNIPYIRVEDAYGKVTEYYDIASGVTPDVVKGETMHSLDCIDCHNRPSHVIPSPEQAVDSAIDNNLISNKLPFIRFKAVEILSANHDDQQAFFSAVDSLANYYKEIYPDVAVNQAQAIKEAQDQLKTIYSETVFPDQKLDWTSHPNNIGHKDSAGCFRCHDGKHFTTSGVMIRLECNLCHSIPSQSSSSQFTTNVSVVRGPEPPTHSHNSWIALHGQAIDTTCVRCHPAKDPKNNYTNLNGKKPAADSSFCGNAQCHGTEWKFMGFKAEEVKPVLQSQLDGLLAANPLAPTPTPTPTLAPGEVQATPTPGAGGGAVSYANGIKEMLDSTCGSCHTGSSGMANLDLSTYETILQGNTTGKGVVAGDPEASIVYTKQKAGGHYGQLDDASLQKLLDWIKAGAPQ